MRTGSDRGVGDVGSDLVEARAAVHRPIVARRERHHRLPAAHPADRGVVFARASRRLGPLVGGATAVAPLRIVLEAFAGEERLLTRRKDERFAAITTGERTVRLHRPTPPPAPPA